MSELLKMSELAERSGVSAGTIKHYLREGLLPEPVRTSRNMAYYPPDFVDRIRVIKRLQEERFMPLKLIKGVLDEDPERVEALIELEDRILERAVTARAEDRRVSAAETRRRYEIPQNVLDRLAELGVLSPTSRGYDADDVADHRGHQPLPRGRVRRGDRLHGLRHAALPRGAPAARRGGGPRPARAPAPARSTPTAPRRSSPRAPSRCAS